MLGNMVISSKTCLLFHTRQKVAILCDPVL